MASYQTAVHLWPHPKSGFWYLVWREGGQAKRRSTKTKKFAEAQAILEATLRHIGTTPRELPKLTFHQALGAWFEDRCRPLRGLATVTIKKYETFVRQVKQVVPSEVMAVDIRPNDIRKILDDLQRKFGLSPSTVKQRYVGLKMVFGWIVEEDMALKSPVKKGDAPHAQAKQRPPWTISDFGALQEAIALEGASDGISCRTRQAYQDLSDLVTVVWLSGMRSIQAYRLQWQDIDLEKMIWVLRSPRENKGGERVQPIHRKLEHLLKRRRLLGGGSVFPSQGRMTTFWTRFKVRNPTFKGWSFHQARSRVVTDLRSMGEKAAAMGLVGHTQEETNELYNHAGAEEFRKALNRL